MRGQMYEEEEGKISLADKSLGRRGVAGVIIHPDKLFILHTALPSAGWSTVPRPSLMF